MGSLKCGLNCRVVCKASTPVIRTLCITGAALLLAVAGLIGLLNSSGGLRAGGATYVPPDGAVVTYFGARMAESGRPLVIGASTDAGAMRPFILAFQVQHPQTAVAYIDASGSAFLARAAAACGGGSAVPDLYLSTSTDQLVRLANDGCAQPLPQAIAAAAPAGAAWRNEVVAFTVEPAAFVYGSRLLNIQAVPRSHVELIDWLRNLQGDPGKIGTYDIEASSDGYGFTAADARQPALYGRLLESLGRAGVRTYCCSNVMVDAVDRGEILFAYNVQLSYAYAAQRAGSRIRVVLPTDYQEIQTRSVMIPRGARDPEDAIALVRFLTSAAGRAIARVQLMAPAIASQPAAAMADVLLDQASVSPQSLSLQDQARRARLIHEWRQGIRAAQPP
jgi:iron(III) transport system substrate-binding protein